MRSELHKKLSYTILTLPAVLIYASMIVFPVLVSLILSFTKWSGFGTPSFIGLQNYITMFKDPVFLHGLRNNALIILGSLFIQIPFGFLLAYLLYRRLVNHRDFFEAMIFLPVSISAIVVAILWNQIFSPAGLFTSLIRMVLHDPRFVFPIFENKTWAISPVLVVIIWMYTGIYMIIFLANLQKISPSIIEAAIIDGARESQILFHIIAPSMIHVIFTTTIFAISGSLKSFDLIFAMTGGGPAHYTEVIAIYMYYHTFKYYKYGFGSAVSIVIVFLSLGLISMLQYIHAKLEKHYHA